VKALRSNHRGEIYPHSASASLISARLFWFPGCISYEPSTGSSDLRSFSLARKYRPPV